MNWVWLLFSKPFIEPPGEGWIWLVWLLWLAFLVIGLVRFKQPEAKKDTPRFWVALITLFATPIFFLLAFRFFDTGEIASISPVVIPGEDTLILLSALPWMFIAIWFGPLAGAVMGAVVGSFTAFWVTHTAFSIILTAALGFIYGAFLYQSYSDKFFRIMRHPFSAAICTIAIAVPLMMIGTLVSTEGAIAYRLDAALTRSYAFISLRALEMIIAAFIISIIVLIKPVPLPTPSETIPSPAQRSMVDRFIWINIPIIVMMLIALIAVVWLIAGKAVARTLQSQMQSTAQLASESMPYYLETGQSLILSYRFDLDAWQDPGKLQQSLNDKIHAVPFFRALVLLDTFGIPRAVAPQNELDRLSFTREELAGIQLAANGELIQSFALPPLGDASASEVSFIAPVWTDGGVPVGVILGRSDMSANPFTQPAIQALGAFTEMGGSGLILDEYGRVLFSSTPDALLGLDLDALPQSQGFDTIVSRHGERKFVYTQMIEARQWKVILTIPTASAQESVLQIASPSMLSLAVFALIAVIVVLITLNGVKRSLGQLSQEARMLSDGNLDRSLAFPNVDEVGQLGSAFEIMRVNLKQRLDEMSRLLMASQSLAGGLDLEQVVMPVLKAALGSGADIARAIIIDRRNADDSPGATAAFGVGRSTGMYAYLDEQIFQLAQSMDVLVIPLAEHFRNLRFSVHRPASLIAVAIRSDDEFIGVIWAAYQQVHTFSDAEQKFMATLAVQARLAITNVRLFQSAEIGRQRLQAVITSSPDPILVFDEQNQLLLMNDAASQASGLIMPSQPGMPVENVIANADLLSLVRRDAEDTTISKEVSLPDKRSYAASVKWVKSGNKRIGKVCVLREITQYKEIDKLKSEFVSTVSHELRTPLQMMKGYATMLQMVGELSDQQKEYQAKIMTSVDQMAGLIDHILDLERINSGMVLKPELVDLRVVLNAAVKTVMPRADQKKIAVVFQPPEDPVLVEVDKALISQAFINLLDNGIRYADMGSSVTIEAGMLDQFATVEIKDNGHGIAPIDLPHLFERNYRRGKADGSGRGKSGFGLAIVYSIIEKHRGEISVESQLGKGSSFMIRLPRKHKSAGESLPV